MKRTNSLLLSILVSIAVLASCGKYTTASSAPPPSAPQDDEVHGLAGTQWAKSEGKCGYGLTFEKSAKMFHYFYACRASVAETRNAMASIGSYEYSDSSIKGTRTGTTCPISDSERDIDLLRIGDELTVKTASVSVTLTRIVEGVPPSNDQVIFGCIDHDGHFTAHDWM